MRKNKKMWIVVAIIIAIVAIIIAIGAFRFYSKDISVRTKSIASNYSFKIDEVTTVIQTERGKKAKFKFYYLTLETSGFEDLSNKDKIKFEKDVYSSLTNRDKNPRIVVEVEKIIENNNEYTFEGTSDYGTILYKNGELLDKEREKKHKKGLPVDEEFKKVEEALKDFYKKQGN